MSGKILLSGNLRRSVLNIFFGLLGLFSLSAEASFNVTLNSSLPSINKGESVSLSWNSTGVPTGYQGGCTLSASPAIITPYAGGFTGNRAVTVNQTGNITFTISCTTHSAMGPGPRGSATKVVAVSEASNSLPTVSISAPSSGSVGSNVTLTANASDSDGSISKVEFYVNNALKCTDTSSPYSCVYELPATGNYTVFAKATDNKGGVTQSSSRSITAGMPGLSLSSNVTTSSDGKATLTWVGVTAGREYKLQKQKNGGSWSDTGHTSSPALVTETSDGTYNYRVAFQVCPATAEICYPGGYSNTVSVVVSLPNSLPTVSISAPSSGSVGSNVTLTANASDSDGSISKVEFYVNNALKCTDTSSPYSCVYELPATGNYTVFAKATDNKGGVTQSSSRSITAGMPGLSLSSNVTTSSDGKATLTWVGVTAGREYKLQKQKNGGSWSDTGHTSSPALVTETSDGTYNYRVAFQVCPATAEICYPGGYSNTVSVVVSLPKSQPEFNPIELLSATEFKVSWYSFSVPERYELEQAILPISLNTALASSTGQPVSMPEQIAYEATFLTEDKWQSIQSSTVDHYIAAADTGIHYFRVKGCSGIETEQDCSDWSNFVRHVSQGKPAEGWSEISTDIYPGTMSYSTGVNARGEAEINIPVILPPGVNGMTPELAFSYNSGRLERLNARKSTAYSNTSYTSADYIGLGWRLSGVSQIHHCYTGLQEIGYPSLTAGRLCLDGEPLIQTAAANSGTGALFVLESNNQIRVEQVNGSLQNAWFKVSLPDGTIREYGKTTYSRHMLTGNYLFVNKWALTKSTDPYGNNIEYEYRYNSIDDNQIYPHKIRYGSEMDTEITFRYAYREEVESITPQKLNEYLTRGELFVMLTNIQIKQMKNGGDYYPIREYILHAEAPSSGDAEVRNFKELTTIQLCGYDQFGSSKQCVQPLKLELTGESAATRLVSKLEDSLGAETEFVYARMIKGGNEAKFDERPFGNILQHVVQSRDIGSGVGGNILPDGENLNTVVTMYRQSNGIGGWREKLYSYQGEGRESTHNRGFLGFYAQKVVDQPTGVVTYKQFRLDVPHVGEVAREITLNEFEEMVADTRRSFNQHAQLFGAHKVYTPYINNSDLLEYEKGELISVKQQSTALVFLDGYVKTKQEVVTTSASYTSSTSSNSWGEYSPLILNSVISTLTKNTSYLNRIQGLSWLIGFTENLETKFYAADSSLSKHEWSKYEPEDISNKIHSATYFEGDNYLERLEIYEYFNSGVLNKKTVSGRNIDVRVDEYLDLFYGRYPSKIKNAAGHLSNIEYDLRYGVAVVKTDPNNRVTVSDYNSLGKIYHIYHPDGYDIDYSYQFCDEAGCSLVNGITPVYKVTESSPVSPSKTTYFDSLDRIIRESTLSLDGRTINKDYIYNDIGLVWRESQPYFVGNEIYYTEYQYDTLSRIKTETHPHGSRILLSYKAVSGQREVSTRKVIYSSTGSLRDFQSKIDRYDANGDLVMRIDASGTSDAVTTLFTYDGAQQQKSVTIAGEMSLTFGYDNAGNRIYLADPNIGMVENTYTALGQILTETDNKNQVTTFSYDVLGRQKTRIDHDGAIAEWHYDPVSNLGAIDYKLQKDPQLLERYKQQYSYISTKLTGITTTVSVDNEPDKSWHKSFSYDDYGRLSTITWPDGEIVQQNYRNGYVDKLINAEDGVVLQQVNELDAFGSSTNISFANNAITIKTTDPRTGRTEYINTMVQSSTIQDLSYSWRSNGLMEQRSNLVTEHGAATDLKEIFEYDRLNRLTDSRTWENGVIKRQQFTDYNDIGNITGRGSNISSDKQLTSYQYGNSIVDGDNAGGHAVTSVSINGAPYTLHYDENGNLYHYESATADNRFVQWNSRNLPVEIIKTGLDNNTPKASDTFRYGPDGSRYFKRSSFLDADGVLRSETTYYIDDYEEVIPDAVTNKAVVKKTYISENVVFITNVSLNGDVSGDFEYLHRDYQGSVDVVTNSNGQRLLSFAYDTFGARKKADWGRELTDEELSILADELMHRTSRGYTGHEHLDRTGIIHMNGRIYDPVLARFLSPDPLVTYPKFSQSYNRYSYVLNNPLGMTDPSGYSPSCSNAKTCTNDEEADRSSVTVLPGVGNYKIHFGTWKKTQGELGKAEGTSRNGQTVKQTDGTVLTPNKKDGILSVDDDGIPTFDESHEDFHSYYLYNKCSKITPGCLFGNVKNGLPRYPAPGASGELVTDEQVSFASPVGYVRHEVSADGGTIINITLPAGTIGLPRHLLNPGIVRRWVSEDKNNVYIHTYGEGTGMLGRPNELLKHQVWDKVDQQVFQWAAGGPQ